VRAGPATLEQVVRRMLDAWVEAVAGDETVLRELATPEVVDGLLARDDRLGTERAVRELQVQRVEVTVAARRGRDQAEKAVGGPTWPRRAASYP
jgi:hypothetical protein